ncbi:MAG TPA: hypothetical protein DEP72_02735 [Clostridiales bacterium]|nr:MAG: hypothetical protein A2Y18_08170 [Clostridiales bacterium GWD2_32_19]HCC07071.1 hypothetical protein [Clostridiales bacterium]
MKSLKRTLASILTVVMMATSINLSFAASTNFTDVDSNSSTAVNRLSSIDIIEGYEDGTFKPEGTITRAEAAAVMVRMLGKESLASYSTGLAQFNDMTSAHWANGYVNVAASAGIIKGYPDGSFGAENKVTYAEIVTMMVRALGAGEAVGASGTWPTNYLNFALIEGLTDNVAIIPNAPATRGNVAIMANETLDIPMWKATGYNSDGTRTFEKTGSTVNLPEETLFIEKLELTKVEMTTVTASLGVDGKPEKFTAQKGSDPAIDYTFADGMAKSVLPGQEIDIFQNEDGEVVSIQLAKDSKQKVVSFMDITSNTTSKVEVTLADGTEKSYDYATVASNILDGVIGAKGSANEDLDLTGKAILDKDGDVTYLYLYNYDSVLIVDEVKVDEDDNVYTIKSDSDMPRTNSSSLVYDLDDEVVYVNNATGSSISLADIKAGDMIMYAGAQEEYILVLPANTVEGTVDAIDSESIEVNGTDYKFSPNFSGSVIDTHEVDDSVELYLDAQGQIAMLDKITGSQSSGEYGIITDMYRDLADAKGNTNAKIELMDLKSGNTTALKVFDAEETDDQGIVFAGVDFFDGTNPTADGELDGVAGDQAGMDTYAELLGQVVKYEITSDKIVIYAVEADEIAVGNITLDVEKEKFTMGATNYYVDGSSVKVYQADSLDDGVMPIKNVDWSSLKDQTAAKSAIMVEFDDDKEVAEYVFFNNSAEVLAKSNDDNVGVITNVRKLTGGDYKVSVTTNEGSKDFYVTEDEAADIDATGFDASTLDLDNSAEWTKFVGILATYSSDAEGYVTKENIEFDNNIKTAKFYEVTSRNEVKMLDNTNAKIAYDSYKNMFVVESEITTSVAAVAATGTITLVPANLVDGDTVTVSGTTFTYNSLDNTAANFTTAADLQADIDALGNVAASVVGNVVTVTASAAGIAGNAITLAKTEDATNAGDITLTGATLSGGIDAINLAIKNIGESEVTSIVETDSDIITYAAAQTDEASTVYYYVVDIDNDGDLENLNGSESVTIMIFDSSEF